MYVVSKHSKPVCHPPTPTPHSSGGPAREPPQYYSGIGHAFNGRAAAHPTNANAAPTDSEREEGREGPREGGRKEKSEAVSRIQCIGRLTALGHCLHRRRTTLAGRLRSAVRACAIICLAYLKAASTTYSREAFMSEGHEIFQLAEKSLLTSRPSGRVSGTRLSP